MDPATVNAVKTSYELLKNQVVETPVLIGSLSHLWYMIDSLVRTYLDGINANGQGLCIDGAELNNIVKLAVHSFAQLSSKSELVEVITKRQKAFDQLLQIENKILAACDKNFSLISVTRSPAVANFVLNTDLIESNDVLLNLKYHSERYNPEGYTEHVGSMNILVEVLVSQNAHNDLTCAYWPRDDLVTASMRELSDLFPDRLASLAADDHNSGEKALSKSYGMSYRCMWQGFFVATKKINRRIFHKQELRLRDAVLAMEDLLKPTHQSPFISSLLGISWDKDAANLYLIYPLAPQRSLYDVFTNPRLLPEYKQQFSAVDKVSILLDIAKAVEHLHRLGCVHGRIKDANVLLYPNSRAKLGEYGVNSFLSNSARLGLKGIHGLRWTPPEVMQQEVYLDEIEPLEERDVNEPPTLEMLAATCPNTLSPSVDIYGLGVLAVVLLTEDLPFYNIPWDEGVKNQLLEGRTPALKTRYNDQVVLQILEESVIKPCVAKPFMRPSAAVITAILEKKYCSMIHTHDQQELQAREEDICKVQTEIDDLAAKIQEHETLVSKGKDIIRRKEEDKLRIHDSKLRRERDLELEHARQKLISFKNELEGLREDKEGAEADLEQLFKLRQIIIDRMAQGINYPLQARMFIPEVPQDELLQIYCDSIESDRYATKLTVQKQAIEPRVGLATMWPPTLIATSPFAALYVPRMEFTPLEIDALHASVEAESFKYQHLVEHLDIIFRVTVSAKMLRTVSLRFHGSFSEFGLGRNGPLVEAAAAATAAAMYDNTPSKTPPPMQPLVAMDHNMRLISTASDTSSMPNFQRGGGNDNNNQDSPDSDDDIAPSTTANSFVNGSNGSRTTAPTRDVLAISRERTVSRVRTSVFATLQQALGGIRDLESYEVQVSPAIVTGGVPDDFPSDDFDILHVQYLSAARGNWNEAVGLRRLGQGFADEEIAGLVENNFTPVHLAAVLGNYDILVELITVGELSATAVDVNGDTILHSACKRGHSKIVKYLTETYHLAADHENVLNITPLQYALKGGYLDIVVYFLEEAPRVVLSGLRDQTYGATLLHWACLSQRSQLVEYLLTRHSLDVEAVSSVDKATPLLWAAYASSKEVVEYLIKHGNANVNARNAQQMTALHLATMSGDIEKTLYLMDNIKMKITEKDINNESPFDVATGAAALFLQARKEKGFVTGSVAEKNK